MNLVHTPKGRVTHRPVERLGGAVLTGCGLVLPFGYSEAEALYPSCRSCARKC